MTKATGTATAATTATTATNAVKIDVDNDTGNANHPITFIDDTSPDGGYEALKANANITVNPATRGLTLSQITASSNISSSGHLNIAGITSSGDVHVDQYIYHDGDLTNYHRFLSNRQIFVVGHSSTLRSGH